MTAWLSDNKDLAREIVRRAEELAKKEDLTGTPGQAAHALGTITLPDGTKRRLHIVHAVDAIITDGKKLVLIIRKNDPGMGELALPGGFLDPTKGSGVESAVKGAAREAAEEAGADLKDVKATPVGKRNINRPFDIRVAKGDGLLKNYGIKDGDIFMVSTQAVRFDVPDLSAVKLKAGDDAKSVHIEDIEDLKNGTVILGVADHKDMIKTALPEQFPAKKPPQRPKRNPGRNSLGG